MSSCEQSSLRLELQGRTSSFKPHSLSSWPESAFVSRGFCVFGPVVMKTLHKELADLAVPWSSNAGRDLCCRTISPSRQFSGTASDAGAVVPSLMSWGPSWHGEPRPPGSAQGCCPCMGPAGRKSSEEAVGLSAASDLRKHGLGAGEKDLQLFKWWKRQEEKGTRAGVQPGAAGDGVGTEISRDELPACRPPLLCRSLTYPP